MMIFFLVFGCFSVLAKVFCNTVTSPQIRIVDVSTKASETRMIPHLVEYRNAFHPLFQQQNRYEQNTEPLKSYVIYDRYPSKIFKEWNSNPPTEFSASEHPILELNRQPNGEFPPDYYYQNNRQQLMPPAKPTLAYRSVYSNVIKVFDNSLEGLDPNRFQTERYVKPFERNFWKSQHPIYYEPIYNQQLFPQRQLHLPENFPKVFSPNDKFHFPSFQYPQLPKIFHPQGGYYDTFTINYDRDNTRHRDEVEVLPEVAVKQKKTFLCGFIRVNQRRFPENGPCSRSDDDLTLVLPEYPDYSNLPNDKIPVEHRRQHFQGKRIKRSEAYESKSRQKRNAFGYSGWSSPFSYENGYEGYFSDNYPSRGGGYNGRNRNQSYKNRYYGGSRYDEYDDDYQNDDSGSRGLTGYLTNGGRRYKNRKSNDDDEDNDDDDDDDNSNNNRDDDSDEEMERMNSNRRDNDRRNDERDRRKNNNNNDDDDYRDNRRNRNNRRYNNNNNNKRYNNDRYDYNNRNRYYGGNSNGYSSNGYGSGYGGYGSNYGGSFGSGGYGSSFGGNGGYGGYAGFGSF